MPPRQKTAGIFHSLKAVKERHKSKKGIVVTVNYTDLHCDTPYELFARVEKLRKASTDVDLEKLSIFERYAQLAAYCAPEGIGNDEAYALFFKVISYFKSEVLANDCRICKSSHDLCSAVSDGRRAFVLTLEDARITDGNISRLDTIYNEGVRVITPLWGGLTCIGGSHESTEGLTEFGKELLSRSFELGMIADISHASECSANDILDIAEGSGGHVMASHSCAHSINPHSRNLRDPQLSRLAELGGIVGVNLYPPHLTGNTASLSDAVHHILHFVNIAGEDAVSLGCDFDGMGIYTDGGENVSSIPSLHREMRSSGMSSSLCEKVLFQNAYDFLTRSL